MNKNTEIAAAIKAIEAMIRAGERESALVHLGSLPTADIARAHRVPVARLWRRAGSPEESLSLLAPFVRPAERKPVAATVEEKTEYASALLRLGAVDEGKRLLGDCGDGPEVTFARITAHIMRWEYAESIPLLREYLARLDSASYGHLVGRVNLAAALAHERLFAELAPELAALLEQTRREEKWLLHGNLWELSAQAAIASREWSHARAALDEAARTLARAGGLDHLFVEKWRAILDYTSAGDDDTGRARLTKLSQRAATAKAWETVRDCDRAIAIGSREPLLIARVYHGTPFSSFRQRLLEDLGADTPAPREFLLVEAGGRPSHIVDIMRGERDDGTPLFKAARLNHQMLIAITRDLYRPMSLAALHSALWPGDYYNPVTSPNRVHQAVRRFRKATAEQGLSIALDEDDGVYRACVSGDLGLRLTDGQRAASAADHTIARLGDAFDGDFSVREAATVLRLPAWTISRTLRRAESEGQVQRTGASSRTRYRIRRRA